MRLYLLFTLAAIVAQASAVSKSTVNTRLNGWYKCPDYTFSDEGSSTGHYSECATFNVPLCYPGICKTPQFADPTIDVFVKRMPATTGDVKTATNVWLLEGDPGYSSTALESSMLDLLMQLNGTANIYTMDYRGTGRSTFLDCVAAQAITTGSPGGRDFDPSETLSCAQELENEYGDLASFSVTSAATDLVTFISKYTNGANTIVYGTSYAEDKAFYMSKRDVDFGIVGDRFLALCSQDATCSSRFKKPNTLPKTLRGLVADFDKDPNSTCATLLKDVKGGYGEYPPSAALTLTLGQMLMDAELRKLIPPVIYRLNRGDANDVDVLNQFIAIFSAGITALSQDDAYFSPLLLYLIDYSEMYERPQPSKTEMEKRFKNALISAGAFAESPRYYAFSKEKSEACDEFNYGKYSAKAITYERDEYWNKTAKIPSHASVLILSSKLNAQTLHEYAETLLETLDGDEKELVAFNTSIHGVLMWTPMGDGSVWAPTCGVEILASYVSNNGKLKGLDKSCVDKMPAFDLTVSTDYQASYFATDDVYDGAFNSSLSFPQ
ncbi:hypothetical protein PF005_g28208 [Phytophthora fragariae]|uniref:Peptidase S33 tripeptidyl aminopeptidase-like C-terminal domain-containing protein n=2 Tax=Phytophthora fragariae TaxID=53985 RepID=A0A6A3Q1C0_9STRA|nr:hypothetical protein PF003_g34025 [Phytophthora fragariae]KAE8920360.1 hypothetical protein PF009_g29343 [Phytophthora fragariae]KAE9066809.1 hypothetical protein PF007_g28302 [Phytophthora fragariae]KAE9168853.1 hypothetical protein PF005_g28208 [Phytophthora fragariae]KAE9171269.1 hypothetical protein PF004_g27625 [Phytophthora fragariae]